MELLLPRRMLSNYHKLHQDDEQDVSKWDIIERRPASRSISWFKFRRLQWRRRKTRRRRSSPSSSSSYSLIRLKVSSLARRRKAMVKMFRASIRKVLKRLKEGQSHFGDLFAGNYLFLQINPTSFKSLQKSYNINPTLPHAF